MSTQIAKPSKRRFSATKRSWQSMVDQALSYARSLGATDAEIDLSENQGLSTTCRMGSVETLEFNQHRSLAITLYLGQQKGSGMTNEFTESSLKETVERAYAIAKYAEADPYTGLADKKLLAKRLPKLDLYHPIKITPQELIEKTVACENFGRSADNRIVNSGGASISTNEHFYLYANTHGFLGAYPTTRYGLSLELIAEQNGLMERDYAYTTARSMDDLDTVEQVAASAAKRALARLNARQINTCTAPVVFMNETACELLSLFISAISGGRIYRRASFLLDAVKAPVFPEWVHIDERPHLARALGSAPFDGEGVKTRDRTWVKSGILQGYIMDSYSARKLKSKSTGNAGGVHNVFISPNATDVHALIKQMHTGLLVTETMGSGTDLVTGDYSCGASGFWVENGEIQFPVHEITIAGNLRTMFQQLIGVGADIDHRHSICSGSMLIERMAIAGK